MIRSSNASLYKLYKSKSFLCEQLYRVFLPEMYLHVSSEMYVSVMTHNQCWLNVTEAPVSRQTRYMGCRVIFIA